MIRILDNKNIHNVVTPNKQLLINVYHELVKHFWVWEVSIETVEFILNKEPETFKKVLTDMISKDDSFMYYSAAEYDIVLNMLKNI